MFDFIKSEFVHFKNLPEKTRKLLISFFFYSTAYPMISIFVNAFIWKNNNNLSYIIFFRAGQFLIVPLSFLITGLLLRKVKINILYFIGAFVIAAASLLTTLWESRTLIDFLLLGGFLGLGTGLYWSNRNYLTLKETNEENRSYFFGLLFSFATLIGLVVTFFTGWLIVFGMSYQLLMAIAFALIFVSGLVVYKRNYETPTIGKLLITNSSYIWMKKRFIHFGIGLTDGIAFFLPSLLILTVLGNEGVLGTLTAVSSVFSAIVIYFYGRKSHTKDNKFYFIVSVLLAFVFNKFIVIIYSLFNGLIINFLWLTVSPPVMKNIDLEVGEIEGKRFSYILDSEFFLNVGRISSLVVCLLIANSYGVSSSLRFSPFILSLFQVVLFIYVEKVKSKFT